ncbi:MAG: AAA family ATPase [Caldilineaceae bacterium]|nr:AAA family ATPase [Caldilineaceae bacterium]
MEDKDRLVDLLPDTFHENVKAALKHWHSNNRQMDHGFSQLFIYRQRQRQLAVQPQLIVNQLLLDALDELQQHYTEDAILIRKRSLDDIPVRFLAHQQNVSESAIYPQQRRAIHRLTKTLLAMNASALETQKALMEQRLEARTYTNLVGVDPALEELTALIDKPEAPWLISLEGLGGIGKTTLADALVRRFIAQGKIDDVAWVSARHQRLDLAGTIHAENKPALTAIELIERLTDQLFFSHKNNESSQKQWEALQERLQSIPHLIVIDNLDTLKDVAELLPTLQKLTNPTKFLLTTRNSLLGTPNVHHFRVAELDRSDARTLIRQEAKVSGLPLLATGTDADLDPIYETVGGSPLALRLVVGQVHLYPLQSILLDLRKAQSETADTLYTYIYRRAWEKLDQISRRTLLAMPLVGPLGADVEYIAEIGNLAIADVYHALNHLVTLNLVQAAGGLHDRAYRIHGLTHSFLEKQVAKWMS